MKECQACGFQDNPPDTDECLNCGESLSKAAAVPVDEPPMPPAEPESKTSTSVPPQSAPMSYAANTFGSEIHQADSSGFILSAVFDGKMRDFEGQDILLNREQVAPGNRSVSSHQHARIFQKDGQWYIQDLSTNQATFVQVRNAVPLEDGMTVVLGQKVFTFQSK